MNTLSAISDQKIIDNFDAMLWALVEEQQDDQVVLSVIKQAFTTGKSVEPTDLGYKYHICTFKNNSAAEITNAIIGDPQEYISRLSRLGYHGIMIKQKSMPVKTKKKLISTFLVMGGYNDREVKLLLKQV